MKNPFFNELIDNISEEIYSNPHFYEERRDARISMPQYLIDFIILDNVMNVQGFETPKGSNFYLFGIEVIPSHEKIITLFHIDSPNNNKFVTFTKT